ncbi:hypothetical protein ACHQM5_012174 [Ranunculus cassubicifolius]
MAATPPISTLLLLIILLLLSSSHAVDKPEAPPPMPDADAPLPPPPDPCFNKLLKLSDCLTFVEMGSNLTMPEKGCCPALANLVSTSPLCLCKLVGNKVNSSLPVPVDLNKALSLPKACKVESPALSLCPVAPMSAPSGSLLGPMMPDGAPMSADGMASPPPPGPGNTGWSIKELSLLAVVGIPSVVVGLLF